MYGRLRKHLANLYLKTYLGLSSAACFLHIIVVSVVIKQLEIVDLFNMFEVLVIFNVMCLLSMSCIITPLALTDISLPCFVIL